MPITDLTGTKWLLNSSFRNYSGYDEDFSINFSSNDANFNTLSTIIGVPIYDDYGRFLGYSEVLIDYNSNTVYDLSSGWTNEAYRTIEITGGTDATNTDLINWLQANATQIIEPQPTDTNKISIGSSKLAKAFIGNSEIASMWLGNVKVYEKSGTPTTLLLDSNGNILKDSNGAYLHPASE